MAKPIQREVSERFVRLENKVTFGRVRSRAPGAAPVSSGGTEIFAATLTVPPPAVSQAEIIHADAAVGVTTRIMASFAPAADTENDHEELADTSMRVVPVAESGQIRFLLSGDAPFVGPFDVLYQLMTP